MTSPIQSNKESELITVQINIATNQLDLGQPEKALQTVRPLVANFPHDFRVLTIAGMIHLSLSNPDQALNFLRRAYDSEPSTAAGLNLSSALIATGQHSRARTVLYKILKNDENYQFRERIVHNIALAYHKERNFLAARKFYRQALETNPSYYMSLLGMAKIEKETGNRGPSKAFLLRAVKACPSCYESVHLLVTAHINDNETKAALTVLQNFTTNPDITPEDKESASHLQSYVATKDPAAAEAVRTISRLRNRKSDSQQSAPQSSPAEDARTTY